MISEMFDTILDTLDNVLSIKELPNFGVLPPIVLPNSQYRGGMSATRAVGKVLEFKKSKGLPTGTLPDGSDNLDDQLWYVAIQAIIDEIVNEAKISTSIYPGIPIQAGGFDATGIPVAVVGFTQSYGIGGTIIE